MQFENNNSSVDHEFELAIKLSLKSLEEEKKRKQEPESFEWDLANAIVESNELFSLEQFRFSDLKASSCSKSSKLEEFDEEPYPLIKRKTNKV